MKLNKGENAPIYEMPWNIRIRDITRQVWTGAKKTTFVWHIWLSFFLFLVFKFRCERLLCIRGFCRQFVFCFFFFFWFLDTPINCTLVTHHMYFIAFVFYSKNERNKTKYQKKCRNKNNNSNNNDTPIRAAAEKYNKTGEHVFWSAAFRTWMTLKTFKLDMCSTR